MLKIKGMSGSAAIEYYTRNDGCGTHALAAGPDGAEPVGYYLRDGIGEDAPAGVWFGSGLAEFGLIEGSAVSEEDAKTLFQDLMSPKIKAERLAEAEEIIAERGLIPSGRAAKAIRDDMVEDARLGNGLPKYKDAKTRADARVEREAFVTAPRAAEILREEQAKSRKAVAFQDFVFSAPKSVSVLYASLMAAGRFGDAQKIMEGHEAGVRAGMGVMTEFAGYSRAGHHGSSTPDRPSVGRYVDAKDWAMAAFTHRTSRNLDPQLHTHVLVPNRVRTVDADGTVKWRSLDSRSQTAVRRAADAAYMRTAEQYITTALPVVYDTREDGKAREIRGISTEARELFSSRNRQMTGPVTQWAAEYEERHGHKPGALLMAAATEIARLETRASKTERISDADFVRVIEERAEKHLGHTLAAEAEKVFVEGALASVERPTEIDRDEVIRSAVADVQGRRSTWTRFDLMESIERSLPTLPADVPHEEAAGLMLDLVDEAMAGRALVGADQLVQVSGLELIASPDSLKHDTGRSIYRPGGGTDERYATVGSLEAEEAILAAAMDAREELVMDKDVVERIIRGGRLSGDQAEAVRQILTSGRKIDVLSAPAGTGKTYTMGVMRHGWEEYTGGRVVGVAPSQKAARVLGDAGITNVMNLDRFEAVQEGRGRREDIEAATLRPGDLVFVDESSMMNRTHALMVRNTIEAAGAKALFAGDPKQMEAVEQGGVFKMLCDHKDVPTNELSTVRRFKDEGGKLRHWEASASLRLRDGDLHSLESYRLHGRIQGGTLEEMQQKIAEAVTADIEHGRTCLVVAGTNEKAKELNAAIRTRLVQQGLVEAGGFPLSDGNAAGRGDIIEARENAYWLKDELGKTVDNHDVFKVIERLPNGSLSVVRVKDEGDTRGDYLKLPEDYFQEHVALGYAGTVHSAEGRTVENGYGLVDGSISRRALYVLTTRGSSENMMFVETHRAADLHNPEVLEAEDPVVVIGAQVEREEAEMTARDWYESELENVGSLRTVGPQYDDLAIQEAQDRYVAAIEERVGPEMMELIAENDPSTVYRQLQLAEFEGHDVEAVLDTALAGRLDDAHEINALVYHRIRNTLQDRVPERPVLLSSYADRTPVLDDEEGQRMMRLAEAMDERRTLLGERAAEGTPQYLLDRLGPAPEEPLERLEWTEKAAAIQAYRERYGVESETDVLGSAPGKGMAGQWLDRRLAQEALGLAPLDQKVQDASNAELQGWIHVYQREQTWAPQSVDTELEQARIERRSHKTQAELTERFNPVNAEVHRGLMRTAAESVTKLEEIDTAYRAWHAETDESRTLAQAAVAELAARGVAQTAPAAAAEDGPELDEDLDDVALDFEDEPDFEFEPEPEYDEEFEVGPQTEEEFALEAELLRARDAVSEIGVRESVRSMEAEEEESPEPSAWLRYEDDAPTLEMDDAAPVMTPDYDRRRPGPGAGQDAGPGFEMSS